MNEPAPRLAIRTLDALRAVADTQRHRILARLVGEPLTAADLAERLGLPRTRVYYHLDLLERHGFVGVVEVRSERAERVYRATAASFAVDRSLLGAEAASLNEARSELLEAAAENARRVPPEDDTLLVQRSFLRLRPERRARLRAALVALAAEYAEPDPDGVEAELVTAVFVVPPSL